MTTISVYIDNGNVYSYEVGTEESAREHAAAIVQTGYRSVSAESGRQLTWFPPHRIVKVKLILEADSSTQYTDNVRGT